MVSDSAALPPKDAWRLGTRGRRDPGWASHARARARAGTADRAKAASRKGLTSRSQMASCLSKSAGNPPPRGTCTDRAKARPKSAGYRATRPYVLRNGLIAATTVCDRAAAFLIVFIALTARLLMCRNIKTSSLQTPATEEEIRASSLQFVRKLSGFRGHPRTTRSPSTRRSIKWPEQPANCSNPSSPTQRRAIATSRLRGRVPEPCTGSNLPTRRAPIETSESAPFVGSWGIGGKGARKAPEGQC